MTKLQQLNVSPFILSQATEGSDWRAPPSPVDRTLVSMGTDFESDIKTVDQFLYFLL